jgi:hypothetical protein
MILVHGETHAIAELYRTHHVWADGPVLSMEIFAPLDPLAIVTVTMQTAKDKLQRRLGILVSRQALALLEGTRELGDSLGMGQIPRAQRNLNFDVKAKTGWAFQVRAGPEVGWIPLDDPEETIADLKWKIARAINYREHAFESIRTQELFEGANGEKLLANATRVLEISRESAAIRVYFVVQVGFVELEVTPLTQVSSV